MEREEQLAERLDEVREMVTELMYVTLTTAISGYANGLYDKKKPGAKDIFDVLKMLQRKYQKKAAEKEG